MTLRVRGFSEHRPDRPPGVIAGNTPVVVAPGSEEAARLEAIGAIVAAGKED